MWNYCAKNLDNSDVTGSVDAAVSPWVIMAGDYVLRDVTRLREPDECHKTSPRRKGHSGSALWAVTCLC